MTLTGQFVVIEEIESLRGRVSLHRSAAHRTADDAAADCFWGPKMSDAVLLEVPKGFSPDDVLTTLRAMMLTGENRSIALNVGVVELGQSWIMRQEEHDGDILEVIAELPPKKCERVFKVRVHHRWSWNAGKRPKWHRATTVTTWTDRELVGLCKLVESQAQDATPIARRVDRGLFAAGSSQIARKQSEGFKQEYASNLFAA